MPRREQAAWLRDGLTMVNVRKLAEQIRHEIDRSLSLSAPGAGGTLPADEALLWQSGERDFAKILGSLPHGENCTAVEIGCRHGRMLKAASRNFGRVVGIDVSELAIARARDALGANPKVELAASHELDLRPISDCSADLVWSFSALSTMPPLAVASFLRDSRRVLKASGALRIQLLFGRELVIKSDDILHPRVYQREAFEQAARLAGMRVAATEPSLPELSSALRARGVESATLTLVPDGAPASVEAIAQALTTLSGEESPSLQALPDLEALSKIGFAAALAERGEEGRARQVLTYVETCCRVAAMDIQDILERVVAKASEVPAAPVSGDAAALAGNMEVVRERFPAAYRILSEAGNAPSGKVRVTGTSQGPAVWREGTCLDHAEKPQQAAATWASRALLEKRAAEAQSVLVVGFGGGYHLEELARGSRREVWCFEPSAEALHAALASRDLRACLRQLRGLSVSQPDQDALDQAQEILVRPQNAMFDGELVQPLRSQMVSRQGLSLLHPRIAVLGPLQGGTTTTGFYTQAALQRIGQCSRGMDMSGFNKGYELLDEMVRSEGGRAISRSAYVQALTTAMMQNFEEKPIDLLVCMAQAPASAAFLAEMRRRGVVTALWFVEDYLRFTYWRDIAKHYDFVFTIQKGECIDSIKRAGAGAVHYLPMACDPLLHRPMALAPAEREEWGSPISFVGAGYHNRQQMFASLAHLPFKIWGSEWPSCRPFDAMVQQNARRISPEEYVKIFNASAINLNLHSSTERDGVEPNGDFVNPRTFELAACGAFQLVDERSLLGECFTVGQELATFSSLADLKDKIAYFSERPEERAAFAARARERALRDHTYDKRMQQMLALIYGTKFQHLKARESSSPWSKMVERSSACPELRARCETARERGEQPTLDALVSDIVTGKGKLSETEQKLMFLFHVKKHILRPATAAKEGA